MRRCAAQLQRVLTCSLVTCTLSLALAGTAGAQGGLEPQRSFSFPLTRDARDEAQVAQDHLHAQRWRQAIEVLQEISEVHRAAVLPEEYRSTATLHSAHAAHPGAANWAREQILSLPPVARDMYRERFGRIAKLASEHAVKDGGRRELVSVAKRWPLCDGSIRAWRVLGDLELESGNPRAALIAWQAAERATGPVHDQEESESSARGMRQRRSTALALIDEAAGADPMDIAGNTRGRGESRASGGTADAPTPTHHTREPDATRRRAPLPSLDAAPWERSLDLTPFSRDSSVARQYDYALQADLADDKVLVNSTLQLYCVDAYTGELDWTGREHHGWSFLSERKRRALYEGLNRSQTLIKPASGGRIAVAALQLPFSELPNQEYQGIEVMKAIPQRRLVAFDLETGERLWDHAPTLRWDESRGAFQPERHGGYAERMLVAGSPVIAGSRILVPCYVLEGRIDYHVACYDLSSGEYLWSTSVVSGQTSRNMFGRALKEFSASPVVVAGNRVVVQTELGTIAALDLATGRILWESLYRQIALPKTPGYQPQRRRLTWRIAPPVVTGSTIIAAPSDSSEIAAFDLRDGRVLWTYDQSILARMNSTDRRSKFNLLIGADSDTVYLSGTRVAALRKDGGVEHPGPFNLLWDFDLPSAFNVERSPRPLLCRDSVFIPTREHRVVLNRETGRVRPALSGEWPLGQSGNPLSDSGLLFTLGADGLNGFFDWDLLIARQLKRLAAAPDDLDTAVATAALYSRRGDTALEHGELFAAKGFLSSAHRILEPMVYGTAGDHSEDDFIPGRAANELHLVLRREARAFESIGQRGDALIALGQARKLAGSREALRDTLLQMEANLHAPVLQSERLAILDDLINTCGDLPLPASAAGATGAKFAVAGGNAEGATTIEFWVLVTRAAVYETRGDMVRAFEDWHAVIDRFAGVELASGKRAGALAIQQIRGKLGLPNGRAAYATFEESAERLYDLALAAKNVGELREIGRRFPHSKTARRAAATRLEWAFASADAVAIAGIVYAPGQAQQPGALLRLGRVLGQQGNHEFERGMLEALLRDDASATSDLAGHGQRKLSDILDEWAAKRPALEDLTPRFGPNVSYSEVERGSFEYVGRYTAPVKAEAAPEELDIYLVRQETTRTRRASEFVDRVECYSSRQPSTPAWQAQLSGAVRSTSTCTLLADRVIFGGQNGVEALDMNGHEVWRHETPLPITSVTGYRGVVVCMLGNGTPEFAQAFDAHTGVALWGINLGQPGAWRAPVLGEGKIVFFSKPYSRATTARIVDIYRGHTIADIDLGAVLEPQVEKTAWIATGKLFLPHFRSLGKSKPSIAAYDVHTGRSLWTCKLPVSEDFEYVARHADATYVITRAGSAESNGGVYVFNEDVGTIRRIMPLRASELPIGLKRRALTTLPTPDLFTFVEVSNQMIVRAMHLPYQTRWSLSIPARGLAERSFMPLPAVSEDCVALAFALKSVDNGFVDEARLIFVDRNTGGRLDAQILHDEFAKASRLELRGLGSSLFVSGRGSNTGGWRLQVLENLR